MNRASLELWRKRIDDQKASGLNVSEWCEKNNLTKHAYYYWKKRVEIAEQGGTDTNKALVFAELNPSPKPIGKTTAQLQISWNDLKISISNADTARLAAEFISQLQKLC
jgi:hypothetical protein